MLALFVPKGMLHYKKKKKVHSFFGPSIFFLRPLKIMAHFEWIIYYLHFYILICGYLFESLVVLTMTTPCSLKIEKWF